MKEILDGLSLRRRPVILLAIFVHTHYEKLDWLFGGELIVNAFEKEIVPIENHVDVRILQGMWAKIDVTNPPAETGMAPDLHQQMLLSAGRLGSSMGFDTHIVAQRPVAENVIPAAHL